MPDTKSVQFIHEFEHVMSDVALPQRLSIINNIAYVSGKIILLH